MWFSESDRNQLCRQDNKLYSCIGGKSSARRFRNTGNFYAPTTGSVDSKLGLASNSTLHPRPAHVASTTRGWLRQLKGLLVEFCPNCATTFASGAGPGRKRLFHVNVDQPCCVGTTKNSTMGDEVGLSGLSVSSVTSLSRSERRGGKTALKAHERPSRAVNSRVV